MALLTPGQDVAEDRIRAWAVGRDDEEPLRGARKNCRVGTGKSIPGHRGNACQEVEKTLLFSAPFPGAP